MPRASCASASGTATRGSRRRARAPSRCGARSYRHVDSILKHGLDGAPLPAAADEPARPLDRSHENVRGRDYYN